MSDFVLLQQLPLETKIETIAKEIYGADGIDIQPEAMQRLALYKKQVIIMYIP